ncbi:hypothetical protein [Maribacter aurantiacus]|uniref:Uncharacterized protein n=1 Tax=Maribacter aurantiacus TaxID=1882343 RepID=A0A5R8M4F8_9FLAO|nr:hypothetical protein [Maribacter aurantiacus]TLF44464.1 hypothetical protein FEK29_11675 [Maribacter aurantiacus]
MKKNLIIMLITTIVIQGCSNDDDNLRLNQMGTVLVETSCNTKENNLAYTIDVDGLNEVEFIITATLPEEFKQEGLRIQFDMKPSKDGLTICTDNFFPNQFYKISNVKLLLDEN